MISPAPKPIKSTPLILAMNRLQKQSKSQMRKFGPRLNEIPWTTEQQVTLPQV